MARQRTVSLFTREWIEIPCQSVSVIGKNVSLFTREWIEIDKSRASTYTSYRLPLYEGVD